MNNETTAIHWFRQDLRLLDNPALSAAAHHAQVFPIYILDEQNASDYFLGEASQWWLYHSLKSLNEDLAGKLSLYKGNPIDILRELICKRPLNYVV